MVIIVMLFENERYQYRFEFRHSVRVHIHSIHYYELLVKIAIGHIYTQLPSSSSWRRARRVEKYMQCMRAFNIYKQRTQTHANEFAGIQKNRGIFFRLWPNQWRRRIFAEADEQRKLNHLVKFSSKWNYTVFVVEWDFFRFFFSLFQTAKYDVCRPTELSRAKQHNVLNH